MTVQVCPQGLEKTPEIIAKIQNEAEAIESVAGQSNVVESGALNALRENDLDIKQGLTMDKTAELMADKLLVLRNFISESPRYVVDRGMNAATGAWDTVKSDFQDGARAASRSLPPLAVIALVTSIAGPVAGLAGLLHGDVFKIVRSAITKVKESDQRTNVSRDKDDRN